MRALLGQLGFRAHGAHRTKSVELWSQGAARIVLGRPESDHSRPTVAGTGDEEHFLVATPDVAIEMRVNQTETWRRAPMSEKSRLDVLRP